MVFSPDIKAKWEALRSAAFGSVGAPYAALGDPLAHPALLMRIVSTLNQDVLLSFDGVTDHIYIAAMESFVYDVSSNKMGSKLVVPKGTQIYQKRGPGGASNAGAIYAMITYGER